MTNVSACPRCNAAVAAGAQFCGSCGASLSGAQPPPPPPLPPQPPQPPQPPPYMPQMPRGFTSAGGGGNIKQASMNGSPQEVFDVAVRAIGNNGGEIHWQQPPQSARFLLARKSAWTTLGFSIKYDGELQVQPMGPGQTNARFSLKVQWGSTIGLLASQVVFVIIAAMFNIYFAYFALFLIIGSVALTAWTVASQVPDKALEDLVRSTQSGGAPVQPQPQQQPRPQQSFTPQPQPAPQPQPPAPQPQPAPAAGGSGDTTAIVEQIKQIAALRDAGAISTEEFEAKKAELLSRI